jgi:hypothetical protein
MSESPVATLSRGEGAETVKCNPSPGVGVIQGPMKRQICQYGEILIGCRNENGSLGGSRHTSMVKESKGSEAATGEGPLRSTFIDDPDMVEIVNLFLEELPIRINLLEGWFLAGDLESLRGLVHQLKGAGGGYGFSLVSEQAESLLRLLDQGPDEWKPRVQIAFDRFIGTLRRAHDARPGHPG